MRAFSSAGLCPSGAVGAGRLRAVGQQMLQYDRIDFGRVRDRRHVAGVPDRPVPRARERVREKPGDRPRRLRRSRPAQDQGRDVDVGVGRQRRSFLRSGSRNDARRARPDARTASSSPRAGSPSCRARPIVDECRHAAVVVAADDAAIDCFRRRPGLRRADARRCRSAVLRMWKQLGSIRVNERRRSGSSTRYLRATPPP